MYGISKMHLHFKLAVASAGNHSREVILLLLIHCLFLLEFCVWLWVCYAVTVMCLSFKLICFAIIKFCNKELAVLL